MVIFMNLPTRKQNRLKDYDYSKNGAYFITICTKDKKEILSRVKIKNVGNAVPGVPCVVLSEYGELTDKTILQMRNFYDDMKIDKYVIMPNHIHLIIRIENGGVPWTAHPTVSKFIGTMKRFINQQIGENIWQKSFYDHIIRDENDYKTKWEYIENNPNRWSEDELYNGN